ncbi:hypothetical protein MRB53_022982 [Persea americana]|uniref:Uncharacterized protein n=1 Tax=Persea americana TaxID=3435 RepID=A0ACC2L882_PERAE|nr:hypothetical protein MRB53_022982 [Persea americana]
MATGILFMVAEKLPALLQSEVLNLSTAKKAIKLMETDLRQVYELLEDDPGLEMNRMELRKWVTNLTDEAQKIEDFVDNFFHNLERRRQRMGCVGSAFLTLKDCVVRRMVVTDIKRLEKSIHKICEDKPEKQVLGFVELVKQLVGGNYPHHLYVCIVGPCGAGKTTLAQEVYNTAAKDKKFSYCVWLCANTTLVSSSPDPIVLLNELLRKIRKVTGHSQEEPIWMDEMVVCENISVALKGKRYLIVLDINFTHSWSSAMNLMKKAFPDDNNGSRIVLTCTPLDIDAHWLPAGAEVHELELPRRTFDDEAVVEATASNSSSSTIPSGLEMTVTDNARRLSLNSIGIYNHIFEHKKTSVSNVRSLLCFPQLTVIGGEVTFPMPPKFKMIRVLDLEDMYFITQLPEEIGELVHLRYLGLRRTGLYRLPNSIGNLRNLQSLDIRGTRVKPIPTAIQKLKRLQYLYMDMDDGSTNGDSLDASSLNSLRVLSVIHTGSLYLERSLQKLPEPDKFPVYLDKLCLKWSLLEQDPMETVEQLRFLEVLKLGCASFLGKKMVCSAKGFRWLQVLELNMLDELEEWIVEKGTMPLLKRLAISFCIRLQMLPQGLEYLGRLEKFEVAGMPDTFNARLQYKVGEDWAKIQHVKSVTVDGIPMGASSQPSEIGEE